MNGAIERCLYLPDVALASDDGAVDLRRAVELISVSARASGQRMQVMVPLAQHHDPLPLLDLCAVHGQALTLCVTPAPFASADFARDVLLLVDLLERRTLTRSVAVELDLRGAQHPPTHFETPLGRTLGHGLWWSREILRQATALWQRPQLQRDLAELARDVRVRHIDVGALVDPPEAPVKAAMRGPFSINTTDDGELPLFGQHTAWCVDGEKTTDERFSLYAARHRQTSDRIVVGHADVQQLARRMRQAEALAYHRIGVAVPTLGVLNDDAFCTAVFDVDDNAQLKHIA